MGSVRGMTHPSLAPALTTACLVLLPAAAGAEVCDKERPGWDGTPATALTEALWLAGSLPAVVLLVATALAVRFRSAWGGLAAVSGWSILIGVIVFAPESGPMGIAQAARAEGCAGSPALFIACVAAICVATILYTAPASDGAPDKEN